jgi:hypothetical protein
VGSLLRFAAGVVAMAALAVHAALSPQRVIELCSGADGPAHCGRLVEAEQLKQLPNLATRDGDTLTVTLFPSGTRVLADTPDRAYALWDYWSPVNAVVLFVTAGDELSYAVLQRANGQLTALPAEPVLAPDRQRLVVADFCSSGCSNELSVWRVSRDGIRKDLVWRPPAPWSNVSATWKDSETLSLQFTPAGTSEARTQERKLGAADWKRP